MISLRRPTTETIRSFLASQAELGFTYEAVGGTGGTLPPRYVVDHTRVCLGHGEEVYRKSRAALQGWAQFRLGWVEVWPPEAPIVVGGLVAVIARRFGVWWLNSCRIVYVVDEEGPSSLFGFAYGTLPDHAGSGEERFLVEWDRETGEVWYDVLAFSRPRWLVARLGYPYMRRLQARFGRESAAAMQRAARMEG